MQNEQGAEVSVAWLRARQIELVNAGRHADAFRLLSESRYGPADAPELWKSLARQTELAGHSGIARLLRDNLLAAGVYAPDLALADAEDALARGDASRARHIYRSQFAEEADDPRVTALRDALGEPAPRQARPIRDDPNGLIREIEQLRRDDRAAEARKLVELALQEGIGDPRLLPLLARTCEAVRDYEAAFEAWRGVADRGGDTAGAARLGMLRMALRLEWLEAADAVAARVFADDGPLEQRLAAGLVLRRPRLWAEILRQGTLPGNRAQVRWDRVATLLLDAGEIGAILWLEAAGLDLGPDVRARLEAGSDHLARIGVPRTLDAALQIRSPDAFLPFPDHTRLPRRSRPFDPRRDRVLLVNSTLAAGGAERQFVMLVRALVENGVAPECIHVALLSLLEDRGERHFLPQLEDLGVTIRNLRQARLDGKEGGLVGLLPSMLRRDVHALEPLVEELRPAVLHGWQDRGALAAGWVGTFASVDRIVMSARNMTPGLDRGMDTGTGGLYRALIDQPNVVLSANSQAGQADYADWLGVETSKVQYLPNAVDLGAIKTKADAAPVDDRSPLRLLGVFRMAPNKRPLLWLRTVAALRDRLDRPVRPVLVGQGPLAAEVRRLAGELGLDDLDFAPGQVSTEKVYAEADAFLLMSRVEGTPNVLLEAQAAGLPVAATLVGGVLDAVLLTGPSAGLLIPVEYGPEEAATAIAPWLTRAVAAPGKPRRAFVAGNYSIEALAGTVMGLYGAVEAGGTR